MISYSVEGFKNGARWLTIWRWPRCIHREFAKRDACASGFRPPAVVRARFAPPKTNAGGLTSRPSQLAWRSDPAATRRSSASTSKSRYPACAVQTRRGILHALRSELACVRWRRGDLGELHLLQQPPALG
jgi:hypothetical protein